MTRVSRKAVNNQREPLSPPRPSRYRRVRFICNLFTHLCCLAMLSLNAMADSDISIVLSDNTEYYHQVADAFRDSVATAHPHLAVELLRSGQVDTTELAVDRLLVTVGTAAANSAQARFPLNPRLSLFVTDSAWQDMAATDADTARHAAVLIDQPLERFIYLAKLLKPESQKIATAFGSLSAPNQAQFDMLARQQGLTLLSVTLQTRDNPVTALSPLFADADIFVAVPDRGLFNQSVARWALFLGYRNKVPVIGFSRAYTQAGALASLQSDPEDIGRQGAAWLDRYLIGDEGLWQAFPPRDFSVVLNPSVARALGIAVGSEDLLHQQLTRLLDGEVSP